MFALVRPELVIFQKIGRVLSGLVTKIVGHPPVELAWDARARMEHVASKVAHTPAGSSLGHAIDHLNSGAGLVERRRLLTAASLIGIALAITIGARNQDPVGATEPLGAAASAALVGSERPRAAHEQKPEIVASAPEAAPAAEAPSSSFASHRGKKHPSAAPQAHKKATTTARGRHP
jgi:hypothetical protein